MLRSKCLSRPSRRTAGSREGAHSRDDVPRLSCTGTVGPLQDAHIMSQDSDTRIVLSPPAGAHPDSREVEMVERKGRGHPDSICDALAELGVEHIEMPATPERVWQAIRAAREGQRRDGSAEMVARVTRGSP